MADKVFQNNSVTLISPFITHPRVPGTNDLLFEWNGNLRAYSLQAQNQPSNTWLRKCSGTAAGNSLLQEVLVRHGPCSQQSLT